MKRLKKVLIKHSCTIKHALKQMDAMGEKTLLVVDDLNRLLGTVTDGDIRGWILNSKSLAKSVSAVMNRSPHALKSGYSLQEANALMLENEIECLPVLDDGKKIISAVWWTELFKNEQKIVKILKLPVVIMAGGEGSRLAPFTKILPKPLMPIGEKPIIELIINRFVVYGCKDFYLSLNYKSNIVKAYFRDFKPKYKISYIQENKPLGTAGSLHFLEGRIHKTFFLSNCDIFIEADYADILKFHNQGKNKITIVSSMKNFMIPYGVCEIKNGGVLGSLREKPEYDFQVNTGMYVLDPTVLKDIPKNRFYNMTDLINDYLEKEEKIGVYPISEKSWFDVGQFDALQEMLKKFGV